MMMYVLNVTDLYWLSSYIVLTLVAASFVLYILVAAPTSRSRSLVIILENRMLHAPWWVLHPIAHTMWDSEYSLFLVDGETVTSFGEHELHWLTKEERKLVSKLPFAVYSVCVLRSGPLLAK